MKNIQRFIFLGLMIGCIGMGWSQERPDFETLIVKEWHLDHYEMGGQKLPAPAGHEKDTMVFYANHKTDSVSGTTIEQGVWSYDKAKGILTVQDIDNRILLTFQVQSISITSCVLQIQDPEGASMVLYMVAKG
jgi:hypothetical protein